MPKFRVKDSLYLPNRQIFALTGEILEGTIKNGMKISVPFNSATAMSLVIDSIEFVLKTGEASDVALCIKCADSDEAELLRSLALKDETLDISPA